MESNENAGFRLVLSYYPIETSSGFEPLMTLTELVIFLDGIGIYLGYSNVDLKGVIRYLKKTLKRIKRNFVNRRAKS